MKWIVAVMVFGCLPVVLARAHAAAQECDRTRAHAQVEAARHAWHKSRPDDALKLLTDSIEECRTFEAYEQLGEYDRDTAPQRGRQSLKDAVDAFIEAEALAANDTERAHALYEYSLLLDQDGQPASAVPLLEKARKADPTNADIALLQARVDSAASHLSAAQIHRALSYPLYKPLHLRAAPEGTDAARPSSVGGRTTAIDASGAGSVAELPFIPIHFITNRTEVDRGSESNVTALADALASPDRRSNRFLLIGHADQRGTDEYNVRLSLQRADAVSALLIERQPSLTGRILTEGHGAHEPLNTGSDAHALWVNRRLQVIVK
jgi:outer membrane protein OmpA-like peptidoglycan-associated protein